MQIRFYINTSPTNKVNKSLGNPIKTINIDIYEAVDVVNPVFRIDKTSIPSEANYMICGEPLNRRYFITAMDFTNAKTTIVAGHVDVLSTYEGFLRNTVLNYIKGAEEINEIEDSNFPIADTMTVERFSFKNWDNLFTNSNLGQRYLLRVADGRAKTDPTPMVKIGDSILYKNKLYTVQGSYSAAYLSAPTEIPLPPAQPYVTVVNGSRIRVYEQNGDVISAKDYIFTTDQVYDGVWMETEQLIAAN